MDESIFRAYDIRGIYPEQINADIAYQIGQAYVDFVKPTKPIAVGRDVRLHSQELQQALIKGVTDAGIDVIDIGLISTEMFYFAVGNYKYGGGIIATASHNPKEWHGFKFVREGVVPISGDSGIKEIQNFVNELKGKIDHSDGGKPTEINYWNGYNYYDNNVQRNLYIDNILYSFSNNYLKMNKLDDLKEVNSLKLKLNSNDDFEVITSGSVGGGIIKPVPIPMMIR